jgi:uncharacterized protein YukE
MATVDANIERAEKSFVRIKERLDYLQSVSPELEVTADIARAEAGMQKALRQLEALRGAKAEMVVDLDTAPVEQGFRRARDAAGTAGDDAGAEFSDGLIAALLSIPIAGAVVGIGAAAAKALMAAFNDGLQVEARTDRLAALTGLEPDDAIRIGRAAAEAYANVFGTSIEANMDTARLAVQFDIIDEDSTTRDAQKVIENLGGIADVLGEDVGAVARAVTTLLRTGMARNAQEAFDIIAAGAREGVNIGEDLLDTLSEYSTQFRKLGLDGPQALGLLRQALSGGARDSDIAADALKEFAIRATDPGMEEAFRRVGFSWDDLSSRISQGGPVAAAALDETLDRLRGIQDRGERSAAALELFGSQGEDLADALTSMDLSSAVDELNGVEGAAQKMFDTLAGNDANSVEQAQRNIEVAADGIKGALASVFAEPLGNFAEWVSQNRGPLLQFFTDLMNGAIDFAIGAAEGVGEFVSGPLADMTEGFGGLLKQFGQKDAGEALEGIASGMRDVKDVTENAVERLQGMRDGLNGFAQGQVQMGYLNDAQLRLADSISKVDAASGDVEKQVRAAAEAMFEEQAAAAAVSESHAELKDRYDASREALIKQLEATGWAREEAELYVDQILQTPEEMRTRYVADTVAAEVGISTFLERYDGRRLTVYVDSQTGRNYELNLPGGLRAMRDGGMLMPMAAGGLTPMAPIAQMVPPRTYRVVGDRMDVSEAYIPLDGSARSMAILLEAMRRMGLQPMAEGGVTGAAYGGQRELVEAHFHMPPDLDENLLVRAAMDDLVFTLRGN